MKTIDLENHFSTDMWVEALRTNKGYPRETPRETSRLCCRCLVAHVGTRTE